MLYVHCERSPSNFITRCIRFFIPCMTFLQNRCVAILSHNFDNFVRKSIRVFGGSSRSAFFSAAHKRSIGFRSGLIGGQSLCLSLSVGQSNTSLQDAPYLLSMNVHLARNFTVKLTLVGFLVQQAAKIIIVQFALAMFRSHFSQNRKTKSEAPI